MRYYLKLLSNGLAICKVKVINPYVANESIDCDALIDTGAEMTTVCISLFKKLTTDKKLQRPLEISTMHQEEMIFKYPLIINIPFNNWSNNDPSYFAVRDISKRKEYKVIVGVDLLRNMQFIYDGIAGSAYLMD